MPYKIWTVGEEVLAADFNDYVQEQVVATFANAAARTAGLTAPNAGQLTYLVDVARHDYWNGAAWIPWYARGGQMSAKVLASNTSVAAGGPVQIITTGTLTIPAGRRLEIRCEGTIFKGGGDATGGGSMIIGVDSVNNAQRNFYCVQSWSTSASVSLRYNNASAGTHSFQMYVLSSVSFVNVELGAILTVDDIGPTTMPT